MRVLVVTSCTNRKKYKPTSQLQPEDFLSVERLAARSAELKSFKISAAEMYTGRQHTLLMEGLEQVRACYGENIVDLHIISAGYGLLSESDVIVPYNVTFQNLKIKQLLVLSDGLQLHERVETLIADYDLVFFLLGKEYVQALRLPFEVSDRVTQIFLLGTGYKKLIPDLSNVHFVPAGEPLRCELNTTQTALKGFVFKKICERVCHDGLQVFEKIKDDPQLIPDIACST